MEAFYNTFMLLFVFVGVQQHLYFFIFFLDKEKWRKTIIWVWTSMRVTQLCQNFHFWVNYPFKLRQTVTKDAFIPRFIPRSSHMRAQHWCCKMTQAVLLMAVCISVKALMSTPVSVSRCDDHDRDTSAVLYKRFQEQLACTNLSFTLSLLYGYTPSLSRSELYYLCIFKCQSCAHFSCF